MKFVVKPIKIEKSAKNCIIIGVFEDGLTLSAKLLDQLTQKRISKLMKQGTFSAKIGQTLPLFHLADQFAQVLLVGCGKEKTLSATQFTKIVTGCVKSLLSTNTIDAVCYLTDLEIENADIVWKVQQIAQIVGDKLYCFDHYKTEKEKTALANFIIALPDAKDQKACDLALKQGLGIAAGVTFTKNLANQPSNVCTPTYLANEAKKLAKTYSAIKTTIVDETGMKKLGMGALLAVAQGSAEEAKLICIEYNGGSRKSAPVAFVGKGVTFDTGGISLKPSDSMLGMKYDMCGAATVMGIMKAAAELKLPMNLVGVIPAVENMPGSRAYKPEDIITSLSGKTIEVLNTDAEGRLALADALTYCERFKPDIVIDIATLTGAVVIALGFQTSGLLSNDQTLANALLKAGEESNDRAWQLPLFDEYQEQIRSPFADMANVGGRAAGTITAACFLSRFTKSFRWAHLDVAGTAAMMAGHHDRMATGRPVPMLMQYLLNRLQPTKGK